MPDLAAHAPLGAHVSSAGVTYRAWAPDFASLHVVIQNESRRARLALERDADGFWSVRDEQGRAGDLYQFELPDARLLPDIASRFQPQGVHGPSECIDPRSYVWKTNAWKRPVWRSQSIYELHVGTFTAEGTYRSLIPRLDHLAALGIEAIQLLPLADFPGERGWGYDGVALFAPARCYGQPDELRALIDEAHARGLMVILDVVYNHLGPVGNYLPSYSKDFFSEHQNLWGSGFNLDGPRAQMTRDFLLQNVIYWLDEFRFDGFRLDATHAIQDSSELHLLVEIARAVQGRGGFVIAEDERNWSPLIRPRQQQGYGFDATWADDFHHQVRVALTGTHRAHLAAFRGSDEDIVDLLNHGWTYRGQPDVRRQGHSRGTECNDLRTSAFIFCIENHDQVGNLPLGDRLEHEVTPAQFRAASVFLCFTPYVPLLFMGQEWAASAPFQFFTDHEHELGKLIFAGRKRDAERVGLSFETHAEVPNPQDRATFIRSKLDWSELDQPAHAGPLALYRAALGLRKTHLRAEILERKNWRAETRSGVIALRYDCGNFHWLLLVSLKAEGKAEPGWPLLTAPAGLHWTPLLSSEDSRFGGAGGDIFMPEEFYGLAAILYEARKGADDAAH